MIKDVALRELNRRVKRRKKQLEEIDIKYEERLEEINNLDSTISECSDQIIQVEKKLVELANKEKEILTKYNPKYDFVLQMGDGSYEVAGIDEIEIVDDIKIIKKSLESDGEIALMQIHFTDIDKDKYNDLQEREWSPFVDLMDYSADAVIRFYDKNEDKLTQLRWDIPRDDVLKAKDLFVKDGSFWLEPVDGSYSYMALIWSENV